MELKDVMQSFVDLIDSYNTISEISTKIEYQKNLETLPAKYELILMRLIYVIMQTKCRNLRIISKEEAKLVVDIIEGKTTKSFDSLVVINELLPPLLKIMGFSYTVHEEDYNILKRLLCTE